MDNDFSLTNEAGKFIETLIRQWQLIISVTLIVSMTTGVASYFAPKEYEAKVLIASTRTSSAVSFGSSIQTFSEEDALSAGGATSLDREARLQSYVLLVKNPVIAEKILAAYSDDFSNGEIVGVGDLLNQVRGDVVGASDTIEIIFTHDDPIVAAQIANEWGRAYVEAVNSVYGGSGINESLAGVQNQTIAARAAYDEAQQNLVDFTRNNKKSELTRQIAEVQTVIDNLTLTRDTISNQLLQTSIDSELLVIQQYFNIASQNEVLALRVDYTNQQDLLKAQVDTFDLARGAVFDEDAKNAIAQLTAKYNQLRAQETFLNSALSMREQIQLGGPAAAASNTLALSLLKTQVYTNNGEFGELQIQLSPPNLSAELVLADLASLITVLETSQAALLDEIEALSSDLLEGEAFSYVDIPLQPTGDLAASIEARYVELLTAEGGLSAIPEDLLAQRDSFEAEALARAEALYKLSGLERFFEFDPSTSPFASEIEAAEQQIRDLRAQLAEENDQENELTRGRDLAWTAYTTLATREAELAISAQTTDTAVILSQPASVPTEDTVSFGRNVLLAASVGLLFGIGVAFFTEFWWRYKGIAIGPIINLGFGTKKSAAK